MNAMNELSRLLAAERAITPPAQAAEQGLERLLGALAIHAAPLPVAAGALQLGGSMVVKWLGVGFAMGLAGAGAASQVWAPPSNLEPAQVAVAVSATQTARPPTVEAVPVVALSVPTESVSHSAPAPTLFRPVASAVAVASASPTFDEELRLITRAKQELDTGRPHLAQVWLDEHAQRFPGGVFGLEREALSIVARCSQRKNPQLASDFAARHPESPLLGQLRRKCGAQGVLDDFSSPTNATAQPGEPTKN